MGCEMNKKQALSKISKLLGKHAAIQDHKLPSSDESRAAAHIARQAANEQKRIAAAALNDRREQLLTQDAEYQRLLTIFNECQRAVFAAGGFGYYRYSAGTLGSLFFSVKAQADTLEDLVDKVKKAAR